MNLSEIEGQLQVSEDVKKQVKVNEKILEEGNIRRGKDKFDIEVQQKIDNLV